MKSILITGGAGFIGSNLIKNLLPSSDFKIICFDNFDDFYSKEQKLLNIKQFHDADNFSFIEGDICHPEDLDRLQKVDVIIHLAAKAGVRSSIENADLYHNVNVFGTKNLLEFAKNRKVEQFIFASSGSVYGLNKHFPWNENESPLPISPYSLTKLSGEMMGHVYSHLYKIRFISLRLFTVYGPGQRPDLAIHKFFNAILENKTITIFGNGTTQRDYTYVDDIVKGIISSIAYNKTLFEIINLGNHSTISLLDLIKEIEEQCLKKAKIVRLPEQPGDVPNTFADISKARKLLGYNPSTQLHHGLKNFLNWYYCHRGIKIIR